MPYYHGNTRLNLYSASSSCYPTSDTSGQSCRIGLPAAPTAGGKLTLVNNASPYGVIRAYKNGSEVLNRVLWGSDSADIYNTGSVSGTDSHYKANGSSIYYNVSTNAASTPSLQIKIETASTGLQSTDGRTIYYALTVDWNGTFGLTDPFKTDNYDTLSMTENKTITITYEKRDYIIGSASGSANPGWGTSYSFSGNWNICSTPTKIYLSVTINSEGSRSDYISLSSSGSWTGTWTASGWKNTKITEISTSTTGISFKATKGRTSKPNLSWSADALYSK